mmetsp:Transcript_18570/g.46797  ORF Transcript_18570/g.46797 Transcript_18570/m.46797 type:complete len:100 (-) Transcript_18570:263-562(-)
MRTQLNLLTRTPYTLHTTLCILVTFTPTFTHSHIHTYVHTCPNAALGGDAEKTGMVKVEKLKAICKKFELTIDIDQLVRDIDTDGSGNIEYEEFKAMLA